ncbi:MAG TPA: UDP-N-acetylglucosamine 1-carboxyvinyltransferase, partial [Myxococcaceae bacterium]|nr:UDP-N-acetylglucosamine 1-carboxyvinyltransferase [Myxococcaceae bacterium]
MDQIHIEGGTRLEGEVRVSGSKNATLPLMAAALLGEGPTTLRNVPDLADVTTLLELLRTMGVDAQRVPGAERHVVRVHAPPNVLPEAPYDLVRKMRASVLVLGPLLARFGRARVSLPGGCAIGARPIDLHLSALTKMGAEVLLEAGDVVARSPAEGLHGAEITFEKISVTGTENLMMAATLARGTTTIQNAAREPEVRDLAELLNKMGARVRGAGTPTIQIEGVEGLGGAQHTIIPDRIETGTFIVAA